MDDPTRILTIADLLQVDVSESNAPLVDAATALPKLLIRYSKPDMLPYTGEKIFIREDLVPLLEQAYNELQTILPGATLKIQYGYRHPDVQKKYFTDRYQAHQAENPGMSEEELNELTHTQVAYPPVAGHPTGGAVDLTIVDSTKASLNMGTEIADYSEPEKCFTYCKSITPVQERNRALLNSIMRNAGFAPFNGEWWHFSYGDREWAAFYNKPTSLFDQIEFTHL